MRKLSIIRLLSVVIACLAVSPAYSQGNKADYPDIVTLLPTSYLLSQQLTIGTGLQVENIAPKRYSLQRLPNWTSTKGQKVLDRVSNATAVVTIGSVWSEDPLYLELRERNIRVINVDAAQALTPKGQSVFAVKKSSGDTSPYVWLNLNNLTLMAANVAHDFKKIWPNHAIKIENNLQELTTKIQELNRNQQNTLLELGIDSVVVMSDVLLDFVPANYLFPLSYLTKPSLDWTDDDMTQLSSLLQDAPGTWLLMSSPPSKAALTKLPKGVKVLIVDPVDRWRNGIDSSAPLNRWQVQFKSY
ncbi:metal ABC transporter solute-binding protein, Zn/Mn family [Vibrio methylphosphonaticus]|uniref:metal ABC transporter solute-binding protein, Zn/Mn family n=1 Tax=Vibrio methylphosphonaticus TaxID=2946866 RepID=UPI00202A2139|nr:zinc ABC transporter substrate-binding protein [Vibrio methylphosphonaticus]MCL9776260.1 zinc ABC transporter substrate-binding protein [Vibrio methylphosphonaticus]